MRRQNDATASGNEMSQKDIPAPEQGAVRDGNHFQRLIRTFSERDDAVMITDINGVIEYVNPPFESMTGYRHEEALGKSAGLVKSNLHGASFYAGMWDALRAGKEFRALFVNRRKNGEIFHEEKTIRPFVDANGTPTHYISTGRDVSERVQMLLTLEHRAYYDSLTGLPNRQLFMDRLGQAIAHAMRHGRNFTLLCVDLDEFKSINDTFGHAVGDDLLRTAAVRMKQCLREEDTVARLGGDEFFLILANMIRREDIEKVTGKIMSAFSRGISYGNRVIRIRASIGACGYPFDGESEAELMHNADMAMYLRKRAGGNGCSFFIGDQEQEWPVDSGQRIPPQAHPSNPGSSAP